MRDGAPGFPAVRFTEMALAGLHERLHLLPAMRAPGACWPSVSCHTHPVTSLVASCSANLRDPVPILALSVLSCPIGRMEGDFYAFKLALLGSSRLGNVSPRPFYQHRSLAGGRILRRAISLRTQVLKLGCWGNQGQPGFFVLEHDVLFLKQLY